MAGTHRVLLLSRTCLVVRIELFSSSCLWCAGCQQDVLLSCWALLSHGRKRPTRYPQFWLTVCNSSRLARKDAHGVLQQEDTQSNPPMREMHQLGQRKTNFLYKLSLGVDIWLRGLDIPLPHVGVSGFEYCLFPTCYWWAPGRQQVAQEVEALTHTWET